MLTTCMQLINGHPVTLVPLLWILEWNPKVKGANTFVVILQHFLLTQPCWNRPRAFVLPSGEKNTTKDNIWTETASVAKTLPEIATLGNSRTTDCLFTSLASVSIITEGLFHSLCCCCSKIILVNCCFWFFPPCVDNEGEINRRLMISYFYTITTCYISL